MALSTQELEIIKYGIDNGKTRQQVESALANFRTGTITTTPQRTEVPTDYISRVKTAVKGSLSEAVGSQKASSAGTMNPFAAGANIAKNVTGAIISPITEAVRPVIEPVLKPVTEAIIETSPAQKFIDMASKHPELSGAVADVLETGLNVAAIEGTAVGATKIPGKVSAVSEKAGNAYSFVKENVAKYPKEIADAITNRKINQQTQTILEEIPVEKLDRYIKAGTEAKTDPRALTPLEKAGETAHRMSKVIKEDLGNIGKQKAATIEPISNTKVPDIATKQIKKIEPLLQKKLTAEERSTVTAYLKELKALGQKPTIGSVDATIDKLQATLFEKSSGVAVPMTTRVKSFINQSIGELNGELKSFVDKTLGSKDYSNLNLSYSNKAKIFKFLNKALGEDGNRGGSLLKRFFSPQDAGTKKLFAAIKKYYGVDLAQDATIAKFVMETLGDVRAKSLLQLPPTTPMGIIEKGLNLVEEKLTSPKRVFQKARRMVNPKQNL